MHKVSTSHEDYLEAIVMLGGDTDHPIRSTDLAKKLQVSKASVNKAVGHLEEQRLVTKPRYGDITLTEDGLKYAQSIYSRHTYLYSFLTKELGIDPETAEKEACLMEHAISDSSFNKWKQYFKKLGL